MDDQDQISQEDSLTADEVTTAQTPANSKAMMVLEMENMIRSHLSSIDRLQIEAEKHQGLLDGIFDNDPIFKKHSDDAKEAARIKSATKQQILKQPQAAELFEKVKSTKSEVKELKSALSDYLREYQRMSGLTEIEDDEGEVREIVYEAKLVKKQFKL
jgi:hypothetical protein